ncbi:hypothetical protein ATCC90586_010898 [Pythium insidiosum]|nr:hypothetical protein ATCC90586_010898 [Pythium insidiosum]
MSAHWTQAVLDYAASKAVLHEKRTTSEADDVGDGENDSSAVDTDANTGDTVVPTTWDSIDRDGGSDGGDEDEEDEIGADPDDESDEI